MNIRTIITAVVVALTFPAAASARTQHLSVARAQAAIRANAALDEPMSVAISGCRRDSTTAITCAVLEVGAHTLIEDNGQRIVADFRYDATVCIVRGRVRVS
jgi:hypothetical protein